MMYIHLCSDDNNALFPGNSNVTFVCELPDTLYLNGAWECALFDINGDLAPSYNVFCDIVEYNVIKGTRLPVLRRVYRQGEFQNLQFVKVAQSTVKRIHIYITDNSLQLLNKKAKATYCTLWLRKCGPITL